MHFILYLVSVKTWGSKGGSKISLWILNFDVLLLTLQQKMFNS